MARKAVRVLVPTACAVCKNRNYWLEKNVKTHPGRLELKKYCPYCRKTTEHREVK
ncbi:MAG: 50S ribosomal protein L33 [Chloroflexi bacterium]|nr:50S ribosomal protein L33 [Chloroflexota bacterium]